MNIIGETTQLLPKIYLLSVFGSWSLKWTLLIHKVLKIRSIDLSINFSFFFFFFFGLGI